MTLFFTLTFTASNLLWSVMTQDTTVWPLANRNMKPTNFSAFLWFIVIGMWEPAVSKIGTSWRLEYLGFESVDFLYWRYLNEALCEMGVQIQQHTQVIHLFSPWPLNLVTFCSHRWYVRYVGKSTPKGTLSTFQRSVSPVLKNKDFIPNFFFRFQKDLIRMDRLLNT